MAQDAYKSRTPGLIFGFRGFKLSSTFGDSCFALDFESFYVALFNGLDFRYTDLYGVPFYYLFPIYGYPEFILGYP